MFDLLLVLVQHPGRVLRKEFLLQSVWPDSFVEEGNITFNIRQLRKALNDNAQAPTYIETIPRRGYRFLPPVESFTTVTPDKDEATIAEERARSIETPVPPKTSRRYVILAMGAFVIFAGALVLGGWLYSKGAGGTPVLSAPFSLEKLSTDGGVFHVAISPDGKNVVYTYRTNQKQSVWLRQLGNSNNVPIIPPSSDFYGGLTIGPDGNTIYFARGSQGAPGLSIYRMPIYGGVPQKLIDQTQGWISVSPDGNRISFVRCPYKDEDYCSLYIANTSDGQNEKKLVTRQRPFRIAANEISRDGKTVAFASGQSRPGSNEFVLGAVDIETGVEREMTSERFFNINYISWLPDQSGCLMTALQLPDNSYRIWNISNNGSASKLTADSETYSRLGLDSTGSLLVSTQIKADFRLMLYQTDNPTAPPSIIGNAFNVSFAPNGRLYFSSNRTGDYEIWSINPDGTDQKQLTSDPAGDLTAIVSPDNKYLFFESSRSGKNHVWRMNADGSDQRQITTDDGGFPLRLAPDGRWLYYRSPLNNTIRRVAIDSGQEELVMKEPGYNTALSPDTTMAAFAQASGQDVAIAIYSLADQKQVKTYRIVNAANLAQMVWSDDGKFLAYVLTDEKGEGGSLWFQPLNSDSPRRIADVSGDEIAELAGFALSHDGKSFAIIKGSWKHDAVLLRGLK
jgi:Tol biopolymer transport system component/DNA-binding winged helix-turn-helix (wHTH) protein